MLSLVNARVFDGRRLLPGTYRVTVDGDKITEVSADPGAPSGEVIDVAGLTVLPGLITSHLHPDFYRFGFSTGTRPGKELPPARSALAHAAELDDTQKVLKPESGRKPGFNEGHTTPA